MVARCAEHFKIWLLQNAKMLKGQSDPKHKFKFFIREHVPEVMREVQEKYRSKVDDIRRQNTTRPAGQKVFYKYMPNGLLVNNYPVKAENEFEAPSIDQRVGISNHYQDYLSKITFHKSDQITAKNSTFTAYTFKALSRDDVNEAYLRMFQIESGATHMIAACRFGDQKDKQIGYCSNGEANVGPKLLDTIKEQNGDNIVVFVARYHRGVQVGLDRFKYILMVGR